MNFKTRVLICPVLLAFTAGLQAQTGLAVINMNGAMIATREGQKAVSQLNARRAAQGNEFEQKRKEILTLQDRLSQGVNTLSDAAKNALYASIAAKKKTYQREIEDAQMDLEADEQKLLQQLGEKILAVVQRYAHDKGYTMVVDVSANPGPILYASADIDITKEIVQLYDQTTAVPPPAPQKPPAK
ncbi:MAG: OmpH family outer membrane protein [Bryobacteraceae bacterium]